MSKLYLIGNAHIDPAWLWGWQEGFGEIHSTWRSALDRLKEFPDLKFTSASAGYYQWIEKIDPEMFGEIKERVKEGRWGVVGGQFIQPDCNIPCGESFARHSLLSQRYFKEKFGVIATTGYNVDSFGHNASIPQILKKSGMDNYVFMRPPVEEETRDNRLFCWESPDGSQVTAFRITPTYSIDEKRTYMFGELKEKADRLGLDLMAFFGLGNHGGGPTIKLVDAINHLDIPDMEYATPDEYFAAVDKENLPVVADELQHFARGCYTAVTSVKMNNRKCENNLLTAETLSVLADHLAGVPYPAKKYHRAWKNLLFNHFHDIMGGCSIKRVFEDANYLYGEIMSITEQEIHHAMRSIARKIDTLCGETLPSYKDKTLRTWHVWEHEKLGTPVVIFNPHTWKVRMAVDMNAVASCIHDAEGKEVPFQIIRGEQLNGGEIPMLKEKIKDVRDIYHTVFMAELEPLGYAVYRLYLHTEAQEEVSREISVTEHTMENDRLRVEFDPVSGEISRIYHKDTKRDILKGRCEAALLDEADCDSWAMFQDSLGEAVGRFATPEFLVMESGPVRAMLRVRMVYENSTLQRDYIMEAGSDVLKVKATVDMKEKHRCFKLAFPAMDTKTTAKIPFGTIVRENGRGEEPCGSWIATGGLAIANNGKYGYDATADEVRLTILRTAVYAEQCGQPFRDEFCEHMDLGIHTFSYALYPYEGNMQAERRAAELNAGLRHFFEGFHDGPLKEQSMSCFSCDSDHVMVTALKQAEDGEDAVLRFYETDGRPETLSLQILGHEMNVPVSHHEIKTLRAGGAELNLLEWTV